MRRTVSGVRCAALLCSLALSLKGAEPPAEHLPPSLPVAPMPRQKLIVGVAVGPPFNIKRADNSWTGISVELWRQIAKQLGVDFELRETNLEGNFAGLAQGWLDVAIGPLTITEQREEVCDFTHAYFASSLAVAVPANRLSDNARLVVALFDLRAWKAILRIAIGLLAIMAVVAGLVWLCERRANPVNFGDGGRPLGGFGTAFWWSAATMTTVGYGDVAPRTFRGRAIAVVWMFVSLVLVSTFTATMASIMTAERFRQYSPIHGLDDLRPIHVGTFADSSSAQYLEANHLRRVQGFQARRVIRGVKERKDPGRVLRRAVSAVYGPQRIPG